jgi:hypothetical protein
VAILLSILFFFCSTGHAKAQLTLPITGGGTGSTVFSTGSILFIGASLFSENNNNLFWDNINKMLGIGTNTPSQALELGLNKILKLSTDKGTYDVLGLIKLKSTTNEAKATIAYEDKNGQEVIWLQTHDHLSYPTNRHKHFSIEASDSLGFKQTRLGEAKAENGDPRFPF